MLPLVSHSVSELIGMGWIYRFVDKSVPVADPNYCVYVGLTVNELKSRIKGHMIKPHSKKLKAKLESILVNGSLHVEGIANLPAWDLGEAETFFIVEHLLVGYNIMNATKVKIDTLAHETRRSMLMSKYPNLFSVRAFMAGSKPSTIKKFASSMDVFGAALEEEKDQADP